MDAFGSAWGQGPPRGNFGPRAISIAISMPGQPGLIRRAPAAEDFFASYLTDARANSL